MRLSGMSRAVLGAGWQGRPAPEHPAPSLCPWRQGGLELPGKRSDSSSRNADTIAPRFCLFFFFFFSFATYLDEAERPEAKLQLVNPHCCQDPEGFLPSVKLNNQIP